MEDSDHKTYKAIGILTWEIDLPDDIDQEEAIEIAREEFDTFFKNTPGVNSAVRVDKIKKKKSRLIRIAEFDPSEILEKISRKDERQDFLIDGEIHQVRLNSHRYFVFKNNMSCVSCGLKGTRMILERYPHQDTPHFNLYGVEDESLVLMTKDHIHTKASGGKDRHSNYQTMCSICNNLKGDQHLPLDAIKKLREYYNENKDKLPKKTFSGGIRSIKDSYTDFEIRGIELTKDHASSDINVFVKPDGSYHGRSVFDHPGDGEEWMACIKSGKELKILSREGGNVKVVFGDSYFVLYENLVGDKEDG